MLPPVVTVIAAVAVFVVSATDVTVSVTEEGLGTIAGAVYVTATPEAVVAGATVPQAVPLQPVPDTDQFTPLFPESFATVAVNVAVVLMGTVAEVAERVTETVATAVTVIVAAAVFVPSATEIAVSVTTGGVGTAAGAV
jgi:hypothetical protein